MVLSFRPLSSADFPLLQRWLSEPHVDSWWHQALDLAAVAKTYAPRIDGTEPTHVYIIDSTSGPIGFIQWYRWADYAEHAVQLGADSYAAGVDLAIGERELIGRGIGPQIIRAFLEACVWAETDIVAVIVDIDSRNARSLRAFEKAGFSQTATVRLKNEHFERHVLRLRADTAIVWEHRPTGSSFSRYEISSITSLLHRAYAPLAEKGWNYSAATQDDNATHERLQRGDTVVAFIDGIIAATGTIYLTPLRRSRTVVYSHAGGAHFGQFAVEPRLQGKGIGFELLLKLEDLAARTGCDFVACDTAEHAADLRAYYSRCGYHFVERVHWQGKSYDSVVLAKPLTRCANSYNPPLTGKTVALEPLAQGHAVDLFPLYADAEIWIFVNAPPPNTLEALTARHRFLESRSSPDGSERWLNWAVRAEGRIVGFVEATVSIDGRVEIAYFIGKGFQGRGFGTDATATMLAFLSQRLTGVDFWATVDARNEPSVRLLMRLGFEVVSNADPQNVRFRRL